MSGFPPPPQPPPPGGGEPQGYPAGDKWGQGSSTPPSGSQAWGNPGQWVPFELAQFGDRCGGWVIDLLIGLGILIVLWLLTFILRIILIGGMLASLAASNNAHNDALLLPGLLGLFGSFSLSCCLIFLPHLTMLLFGLYDSVYLVGKRGASIGQKAMKLRVVTAQGTLVPMPTLLLRLLIWMLFTLLPVLWIVDLLWPLWDNQRQTLHDKAVNTFVIKIRER